MIFLVYCIVSLLNCMICLSCHPDLRDIFHTPTAQYSLFVLKVPLNTSKLSYFVTMTVRLQYSSQVVVYCSSEYLGDRFTRDKPKWLHDSAAELWSVPVCRGVIVIRPMGRHQWCQAGPTEKGSSSQPAGIQRTVLSVNSGDMPEHFGPAPPRVRSAS